MSRLAALAAEQPDHPCLPAGMTLSHVIELIERVARHIGLGAQRREALLRMIRQTAPGDWTDDATDPVCFRSQQDLAQDLGITDRAVRAHEHAFAGLGLALIDTSANGRRSGRVLSGGRRLGINFRPLIERLDWLISLDQRHRDECRRMTVLRLECSAAKRDVRQALDRLLEVQPQNPSVIDLCRELAGWPRRYAGFRTADSLSEHLDVIRCARRRALDLLECLDDSSGTAESQIPAILNTTQKNSESCSGSSAMKQPARKRADATYKTVQPNGWPGCTENMIGGVGPNGNLDDLSWLTPQIVRQIAGEDFVFYLDAHCPDARITEEGLRSAAIMLLRDLGISESAWEEAMTVFGSLRASLAILIIDANRRHPTRPIHKPGGALRAFTRLQRQGGFNLAGSLIGLVERRRQAWLD